MLSARSVLLEEKKKKKIIKADCYKQSWWCPVWVDLSASLVESLGIHSEVSTGCRDPSLSSFHT